ncbi:autotransporter domain-containing protein [Luteimonas yindakuii]|uniref:Autotransporter domain-containing protein n=2 Tax=Luteimonas yindakuii TaxID=2565782 RepID=A0A4Z1R5I6_9GAMM|nr:autotransporter domain-containing protein [Luteimonas yindakuii]
MFDTRPHLATVCLAALMLSACGSGGGTVPSLPPAAPPPAAPPPPPAGAFNPCPMPVTSNCNVTLAKGESQDLPVTQSGHALNLRGDGQLTLLPGNYRFDDGVRIEGGLLQMSYRTILQANVRVEPQGVLRTSSGNQIVGDVENHGNAEVWGTIDGDFLNRGTVVLGEIVSGDLHNDNRLEVLGATYGNALLIGGDLSQSNVGVFAFALAPAGWDSPQPLRVDGRATLAGTLELRVHDDAWAPYPLPATGGHHLIHARGGVSGRFAEWTSPGLAISGSPRYGANDVWFDLVRISLPAAAAAQGLQGRITQASAVNVERALARVDGYALAPPASLDDGQRRMLASAASVLWLRDPSRARRSLDSLAGHAHPAMSGALHRHAAHAAARLDARLAGQRFEAGPRHWTQDIRQHAAGQQLEGLASGIDQWLSPRLLVGGSVSSGRMSFDVDELGGHGSGDAPAAGVHAHYRGRGWHATGAVGVAQTRLQLQRPIELGAAGIHVVRTRRDFVHTHLHGELGRDLPFAGGQLVPFVALDHGIVRGNGFAEHGDTGFELMAGPSRQARLTTTVGVRFARDWRTGARPLRLELDARHRRDLDREDPIHAAFRGAPDVGFALPGAHGSADTTLRMGLAGSLGRNTHWWLDGSRGVHGAHRDSGLAIGLRHALR